MASASVVVRTIDELRAVEAEWSEFLRAQAGDHDVRQHPLWILGVNKFPFEQATPFIVIVRDNKGIRCVAPFFILPRKVTTEFGPYDLPAPRLTVIRPFGDRLVHRADSPPDENVRLVLQALAPLGKEFDAIWLPEIRVPGDFWDCFHGGRSVQQGFRLAVHQPSLETVQQIDLPASFDQYMASLNRKVRGNRRSQLRKLEKACGQLTMSVATRPDEMRGFFAVADMIRNKSWKGQKFARDRWMDENRLRFHEEMAKHGWVRGYLLNCGDRPIAYRLGYPYRNTFVAEDIAYDPEFRSYGPGGSLLLLTLESLCQEFGGCQVLLQPYDTEFKRNFANSSYDIGRAIVIPNRSMRLRLVYGSHRFLADQLHRAKPTLKRVRAFVKRGRNGGKSTESD